jgi:S-formylglutathione hydrolase FrmB
VQSFRTIEVAEFRFPHARPAPRDVQEPGAPGAGRHDALRPARERLGTTNLPLVLLLHGVYGSHWAWALKGGAHVTAARLIERGEIPPMVLAMPSDGLWGDGSGYVRHASGQDYERFIVDDVPACAGQVLPGTIGASSPVFIAGLSMGGFGALRLGAKHPTRFRGVSGHSSITHFSQMARFVEEPLSSYGPPPDAEQSVLHWMELNRAQLPPVRFDCGTADPLIDENRQLHRELEARGIPHVYQEFPGGHEWPYWELHLADSLRFFAGVLR